MPAMLRMEGICKSYGGAPALADVSFDLKPGEVHALIGENGAGKSTLIKIVTGAVAPDSGTLEVQGRPLLRNSPAAAKAAGIAAIYQQPALFPDLSVAENLALGLERGLRVDWRRRREQARALLERVGAPIDVDAAVRTLSMPEQQMVEIARALGADARILILDEPTASLSDREVERLFAVLRELKAQGAGLVYISHRLEELSEIADRVTVLRDGRVVGTRTDIDKAELIRLMVGRELSAVFPKRAVPIGEMVLEARDVCAGRVRKASIGIRRGEIVGLSGLVGSGRTELAQILFGLNPANSGEIRLNGAAARIESPGDAVAQGIAYVPEDRRRHGVILDMTVGANATLALLRGLRLPDDRAIASEYVAKLGIKTRSTATAVGNLSGGNQQKVALSRWLATAPKVLILDEPTQGIDVGAKSEIHRLMVDLAERGMAILMISSELPEILGMSDRIAVMRDGTIAGVLEREQATPEGIMALALGHAPRGAYVA